MNWDDARIFLAISRHRTLRSAAKILNIDQATVGRHLASLEQSLGCTLFLRSSSGYELTVAGEVAFKAAERMERSANELERQVQGLDSRLAGEVKITTTELLALDFLLPALQRLHADHPDVSVQLHASSHMQNLSKREADVAIRTVKPDNPDLVARRLARWPMGLFASSQYLLEHGEPAPGSHFEGHDLVVYQPWLDANRKLTLVGEPALKGRIVVGASSSLLLRNAIKAGLGLGEIPTYMGEADDLVRVWPGRERAEPYEVWLVTHEDLRHTARIRTVIDYIAAAFRAP